ncbi:MAG: hypothetical protein U1F36_05765 [Planctomycetota bacterium]
MTRLPLLLVTCGVLTLCGGLVLAQEKDEPRRAEPDPWIKDDDGALARLGYVAVGRIPFGDGHDSVRMQEDLGELPLLFVETAHFRLCCELPAFDMPRDKERRARLLPELEALSRKLPKLDPRKLRSVDPWLRAHLFAQRLEDLYSEFARIAGVEDAAFPPADQTFYFRGDAPPRWRDPWMGRGPFLGQRGKFLVALFRKTSTCGRYLSTFTGAGRDSPTRWYFEKSDAALFATAIDFADGAYRDDEALYAHVIHNVTHCLIDALRGYSYDVPVWWSEGLCHWLRREHCPEHNDFEAIKETDKRAYTVFDWPEKVRQRVGNGLVRPLHDIGDRFRCDDFDLVDHMTCWSRVDFLLSQFPAERFAAFLRGMKGLVDARGAAPSPEQVCAAQRKLIEEVFGCDPDRLDEQWREWVTRNRRRK